jgi:hypothetical protein
LLVVLFVFAGIWKKGGKEKERKGKKRKKKTRFSLGFLFYFLV